MCLTFPLPYVLITWLLPTFIFCRRGSSPATAAESFISDLVSILRMLYTSILIGYYGVKRTIVDDTRAAREITGTVVALSNKRMTNCTWHFISEAFNRTGQLVRPPCYPLVILVIVRSFQYISQDGSCSGSFSAKSGRSKRLLGDCQVTSGTSIWAIALSLLETRELLNVILLVPVSDRNDFWQRAGFCQVVG